MTLGLIHEAQAAGARLHEACEVVGISARSVERWRANPAAVDGRKAPRPRPANALSRLEQERVLAAMTSPEHREVSPKQLVPRLADEGVYLASESTMYRLRHQFELGAKCTSTSRTHVTRGTTVHCADGPNQVWSWDITYLPTTVRGRFLFLYLVIDVWSRRIVGWRVHTRETAELAAEMIQGICEASGIDPKGLVLHSDNGTPMRGNTMVATLQWLGIVPSFSRAHVSDDNPYSEALFRTLKYTPSYPRRPFIDADAASLWVTRFVDWYNTEHRHSGIRFVTPDERHHGRDVDVLAKRAALYERARSANPLRWSSSTRNWTPVATVTLNRKLTTQADAA